MKFQFVILKIFFVVILSLKTSTTSYTAYEHDVSAVATAMVEVSEEFYIKKLAKFDVIVYGQFTRRLLDVVSAYMEILGNKSATTIQFIGSSDNFIPNLDKSAVLFFPNEFSLFKFTESIDLINRSPVYFKFLVYTENEPSGQPTLTKYVYDITFA